MIRVAVSGAGGRMGRLVAETVAAGDDTELVALYDPLHGGEALAAGTISATAEDCADADVVVEFTRPDVVMGNIETWRGFGLHTVVGTSGFDAARLDQVRRMWGEGPPNCLIVPNFSVGAVVMMRLAEIAAPHFGGVEVIEMHHHDKIDAPSGTALATAERMAAARPDAAPASGEGERVPGARGGDVAGIRVHSVRLPGMVAHQEVLFGGVGDTLSIRHDTTDWHAFMPGVVLAIRKVGELSEPVSVGIEELLGI